MILPSPCPEPNRCGDRRLGRIMPFSATEAGLVCRWRLAWMSPTFQKCTTRLYPFGNYHEPFCFGEQLKRWGLFHDQQLGRERMPIYIDSLNKRFTKHGFTRIFHLDQDPMRQDKLTTWIEYLNYEYRWHDEFVYLVKCHQAQYDFAWKQLVDSKVLRPWETEQFIFHRRKIVSELETERRRAEGKACIAASFVKTRKRHCESSRSELLQNWLIEAQFDLDAAQKERNLTNLRFIAIKTFLKETMYHRIDTGRRG